MCYVGLHFVGCLFHHFFCRHTFQLALGKLCPFPGAPNTFSTGRSAYLMVRFEGWQALGGAGGGCESPKNWNDTWIYCTWAKLTILGGRNHPHTMVNFNRIGLSYFSATSVLELLIVDSVQRPHLEKHTSKERIQASKTFQPLATGAWAEGKALGSFNSHSCLSSGL